MMEQNYQVLDIEENVDGSANILVRVQQGGRGVPVYFLLMNIRDDSAEGVVYDLLIGRGRIGQDRMAQRNRIERSVSGNSGRSDRRRLERRIAEWGLRPLFP